MLPQNCTLTFEWVGRAWSPAHSWPSRPHPTPQASLVLPATPTPQVLPDGDCGGGGRGALWWRRVPAHSPYLQDRVSDPFSKCCSPRTRMH